MDDKTGDPLPGAVVHIKGTTHEVVADNTGEFKFITGQRIPVVYIVSYVGYKTREIEVGNYDHAELKLTGGNAQLNDVVVVGYGTQRRSDVTGAVAGVSKTALSQPATSFILTTNLIFSWWLFYNVYFRNIKITPHKILLNLKNYR